MKIKVHKHLEEWAKYGGITDLFTCQLEAQHFY